MHALTRQYLREHDHLQDMVDDAREELDDEDEPAADELERAVASLAEMEEDEETGGFRQRTDNRAIFTRAHHRPDVSGRRYGAGAEHAYTHGDGDDEASDVGSDHEHDTASENGDDGIVQDRPILV